MQMYVTFDSDVGLAEKLINGEVIHFGFGSPNENGPLFIVRPRFYRGPYMDQLLYWMNSISCSISVLAHCRHLKVNALVYNVSEQSIADIWEQITFTTEAIY